MLETEKALIDEKDGSFYGRPLGSKDKKYKSIKNKRRTLIEKKT